MARAGSQPLAAFAAVALLSITGFACLGSSSETDDPSTSDPRLREERIEQLRQAIDRDHATLEDLITRPGVEDGPQLHDDPELRAIAARLSEHERALERLETAAKAAK